MNGALEIMLAKQFFCFILWNQSLCKVPLVIDMPL